MSFARAASAAALVAAVFAISPRAAAAEGPRVAFVDGVIGYGGVDGEAAAGYVERAVVRAGFRAVRDPERLPCQGDLTCLIDRGRAAGAAIAVDGVAVAITGELSLSLSIVDLRSGVAWKYTVDGADFAGDGAGLAAAMATAWGGGVPDDGGDRRTRRRRAAWATAATAVVLAAVGTWSYAEAHARRNAFLDEHVDENGDVYGISPADAERHEQKTRRLAAAGMALWSAAGTAGVGAGVLFARGGASEELRPAGLVVTGRF